MSERAERGELLLWRPLLNVSPETIRAALTEKGIPWVEDETNAPGPRLPCGTIFAPVLPAITARFPQAEEAMGRTARIFADEDDYFLGEARRFLAAEGNASLDGPCLWVRWKPLQELHPALRRYALRLACPVKLDAATTEALMSLSPGQKMNLPEDGLAECSNEYLHFILANPAPPTPGKLIVQPWHGETGDGKCVQAVKRSVYEQCELRFLRPGDRMHPLGAKGSKSMQDYFVDKKVPRPFRSYTPLLCIGNQCDLGYRHGRRGRSAGQSE